jgi:outer membrane protein assembly factor BamE (lipoprotein component of BamABCDE complex)
MNLNRVRKPGLAALALLCLFLAACGGGKISQENFNKIQVGMTQAEVQKILGEPTESSSLDIAGFSGTTSTWRAGDTTVTIQFVNGKVVAKQYSKPSQ